MEMEAHKLKLKPCYRSLIKEKRKDQEAILLETLDLENKLQRAEALRDKVSPLKVEELLQQLEDAKSRAETGGDKPRNQETSLRSLTCSIEKWLAEIYELGAVEIMEELKKTIVHQRKRFSARSRY